MNEQAWCRLGAVVDLPADGGRYVEVGGRRLAVFRHGEGVRVIDDACPHAGGSLSAGHVDAEGCIVCPWHAWPFALDDGRCPDNPAIAVRVYESRIVDGDVQVRLTN